MTDIHDKLNKIREKVDGGNYGRLYGAKETADERLKIIYAQQRELAPKTLKTVPEVDAWVRRRPEYEAAVDAKANAYADWKTAETYMKLSFAEFDVWRSEEATNRGLDRRSTG